MVSWEVREDAIRLKIRDAADEFRWRLDASNAFKGGIRRSI